MKPYRTVSHHPDTDPFFDLEAYIQQELEEINAREAAHPDKLQFIARDRQKVNDLIAIYNKLAYLTLYPLYKDLEPIIRERLSEPGGDVVIYYNRRDVGELPYITVG